MGGSYLKVRLLIMELSKVRLSSNLHVKNLRVISETSEGCNPTQEHLSIGSQLRSIVPGNEIEQHSFKQVVTHSVHSSIAFSTWSRFESVHRIPRWSLKDCEKL